MWSDLWTHRIYTLYNALSLIPIMKIESAAILYNRNNTAFLLSWKGQIMLSRPSFILFFPALTSTPHYLFTYLKKIWLQSWFWSLLKSHSGIILKTSEFAHGTKFTEAQTWWNNFFLLFKKKIDFTFILFYFTVLFCTPCYKISSCCDVWILHGASSSCHLK